MKNKDGSKLRDSERLRKLAKKKAIRFLDSKPELCKSDFAFTSANQNDKLISKNKEIPSTNQKMGNWQSEVTPARTSFRVTPRMIKILQLLKTVPVLPKAQKILEKDSDIPQRTFYHLIEKLELYGFILHIPKTYPKLYKIHSDIEKSLCHFSEGKSQNGKLPKNENSNLNSDSKKKKGTSPKGSQYMSRFSPNDKSNPLDQNNKDSSLCHFAISEDLGSLPRQSNPINEIDEKVLRSHNYFYKILIQRKPAYLNKMLSKTIWFEQVHMKNWHYFRGELSMFGCEAIIQFNPNMVTVWLNNIFGRNPHENNLEANKRILKIKNFLEDSYAGLYLAPHIFIRRVENTGIEQAWIHHNLALKAKQQNITLRGRNWEIDSSKDTPELEAINDLKASEHLSEELEDFDFRAKEDVYFRDVISNQTKHTDILKDLQTSIIQIAGGTMTTWQITEANLQSNQELRLRIEKLEIKSPIVSPEFSIVKLLSPLQISILKFIRKYPECPRSLIASKLSIKIGSVCGTVFRLKKIGLVKEINSLLIPK